MILGRGTSETTTGGRASTGACGKTSRAACPRPRPPFRNYNRGRTSSEGKWGTPRASTSPPPWPAAWVYGRSSDLVVSSRSGSITSGEAAREASGMFQEGYVRPLLVCRLALDGESSGGLASTPSANSHRERWRELAPRNRGNRRNTERKVPSPAGRSLPSWKMWGEAGSLFYGAGCARGTTPKAYNPTERRPHYCRE